MDRNDIEPGQNWEDEIGAAIRASQLVVVVLTKSACLSPFVEQEVDAALAAGKRILPIKLNAKVSDRDIKKGLPKLEMHSHIDGGSITGLGAVEKIIGAVKKDYGLHLTGEVLTFETLQDLVKDISEHKTESLRIFLIDGGMTLRTLLRSGPVDRLVANSAGKLAIQCLFVDTDVRDLVKGTPAAKNGLKEIPSAESVSAIFEGILQASLWIHSNGPHDGDLNDSLTALGEIRDKHGVRAVVEAKTIPLLPVNRLILTDSYCYIPAFFPYEDGLQVRKLGYYALRFSAQTHVYQVARNYFTHYWKSGKNAL